MPSGNIVISAFGRLWAADTSTNNATVYFSDLLAGHVWSQWLSQFRGGERVAPKVLGNAAYPVIDKAAGAYVKQRAD